jgi:hypothetical protein
VALNAGRGVHLGDTDPHGFRLAFTAAAQRRPRCSPRRHHGSLAGVVAEVTNAQRRPRCSPRRHEQPRHVQLAALLRSTKAEVFTSATPSRTQPERAGQRPRASRGHVVSQQRRFYLFGCEGSPEVRGPARRPRACLARVALDARDSSARPTEGRRNGRRGCCRGPRRSGTGDRR